MQHTLQSTTLACFALVSLVAAGCGGDATTGGGGSGGGTTSGTSVTTGTMTSSTTSTGTGSPACMGTSTTDLPGVHIVIDESQCTFSLADPVQMVQIPYQIVIDQDVPAVVARPQDGGMCGQAGASGLIPFEKVDGNQQQYCLCDLGLCAPPPMTPVTLKKGSYPQTFTWDKHNWFGPSDTGNPEGMLFTTGDYTLTVNAIGTQGAQMTGFVVSATMPIHIVP